jgi:hypothetical protein
MSAAGNVTIAGAGAIIRTPRLSVWPIIAAASVAGWACAASAETMQSALVKAYQNNPQLNAQRANARSSTKTYRRRFLAIVRN